MNDCDRLRPVLVRMVEGDAGPDEALEFGKHLSDCTVCRILLARQRRIAEMVSELGEPIEVDESFLRQVMDSLPDGPPPRPARDRRRSAAWRGLKLASFLILGCLVVPRTGDVSPLLNGLGELPHWVPAAQPETLGDLPGAMGGVTGFLVAALARAGAGAGFETGLPPAAAGLLAALVAGATTMFAALSACLGLAARAVARTIN